MDNFADDRQLFVARGSESSRRLKKKSSTKIVCTQKNVNHCNFAGICQMTTTQCCGNRCSPPPPPPPAMDAMEDSFHRQLFISHERFVKKVNNQDSSPFRSRRLKKKSKYETKCKQENVNYCNNAGVCTMTTTQTCN